MRARLSWRLAALLPLVLLTTACPLDTRTLDAAPANDGASAGTSGSAGAGSSAGDAGTSGSAGNGSAGDGTSGSAGNGSAGNGSTNGDGGGSTAGSGGDGASGSAGAGGDGSSAGNGSAGAVSGACPDLDGDGQPDCGESLVQNPAFDSQSLASWQADSATEQSWQNKDADGRSGSGSLSVRNTNQSTAVSGLTMSGTGQCIAATPGSYELFTQLFIAGDQGSTGSGGINLSFFAANDCSGSALFGRTSNLPGAPDSWTLAHVDADAPDGTQSMSVRLVSVKTFDAAPLDVLFDDVLVKRK